MFHSKSAPHHGHLPRGNPNLADAVLQDVTEVAALAVAIHLAASGRNAGENERSTVLKKVSNILIGWQNIWRLPKVWR